MFAELLDCAIVGIDGAVRARQHHAAFHGDENERGECVDVGAAGEVRVSFRQGIRGWLRSIPESFAR